MATLDDRLSRISTQWSLVFQAHGADSGQAAIQTLMLRYTGAVYRYLLGALRDEDAAQDLAQSFAIKFLEGRFRGAQPERGRFRNYLKTALIHLIQDHHRARQAGPVPLNSDVEPAAPMESEKSEQLFVTTWRSEVLERTWKALARFNLIYHAALRLRIESPDMTSTEMAQRLTGQLGKPINAALVRKSLQRAHDKFADLLIDEVAQTLQTPSAEELRIELEALDLLRYCRSALERWKP